MGADAKYREIARAIALDQYGYVTTRDAAAMGIPPVELPKLASRGGLESIAYGLYRVTDVPPTPYDQYAEALLRVGDDAYLHGESVLALFSLADVNPRQVKVAVPRRARPQLPPFVALTQTQPGARTTLYEGLAAQPVADALLDCSGRVEGSRLLAAVKQARAEGLLTTTEWQRVRKGLRHTAAQRPFAGATHSQFGATGGTRITTTCEHGAGRCRIDASTNECFMQ